MAGCCFATSSTGGGGGPFIHPSADPLLIPAGRRILDWLYTLPTRADNRVISGQYHLDHINTINAQTGVWVAMVQDRIINAEASGWLGWRNGVPANYQTHWNNGGIVQENPVFGNPAIKGFAKDKAFSSAQATQLMTTGTTINTDFLTVVNGWCDRIEPLVSANVPIFLRPFHEMNGAIYWWNSPGAAAFKDMWEFFFNYITKTRGFHNFLWCYAPTRYAGNFMTWYPNPATVDIAGMDWYLEVSNSPSLNYKAADFTETNAYITATGKPFFLLEYGPHGGPISSFTAPADYSKLLPALKAYCPRCVGWASWSVEWSMRAQNSVNAPAALNDPWTINRPDLPDFRA
ncbi:MAG: hypothetical protein IPK75_19960 [Acidobacteria bacterium]|nr:hypothetical protein [Acidobacteriota bacterium]